VTNPSPPTPDSMQPDPLRLVAPGVGSSSRRTPSERITRLVVRFLAHPLTTSAARVVVVGLALALWGRFFALAVLP